MKISSIIWDSLTNVLCIFCLLCGDYKLKLAVKSWKAFLKDQKLLKTYINNSFLTISALLLQFLDVIKGIGKM